jgi:hypothetical protein
MNNWFYLKKLIFKFTSLPKHIKWWIVIKDLYETTHDEFCVRSINKSANWGIETFISFVACKRTWIDGEKENIKSWFQRKHTI